MPFFPHQAANSCLRRARRLLNVARTQGTGSRARDDLRRMALVMGVTAIDSYMHGIIYRRLSDVRWKKALPKALRTLQISFEDFAALADASIDAQREGRRSRPWVQVKNVVHSVLLTQTFQSFEQIGRAFALSGIEKGWAKVSDEIGEPAQTIKNRLNPLVHRRNQIVHEGDMARMSRPQKLSFNSIDKAAVADDLDWIEKLLTGIQAVVDAEQ
ncbi:MAG: HEPN domain-containing protein [Gammaproteobacteria bacterium]